MLPLSWETAVAGRLHSTTPSSVACLSGCFNFTSDQRISASLTKERLNGIQYKVIMPASLRVVPQIHLEDCSNTHHWGAKGEWQHGYDHHCHPQLHSFPAFPTCLAPLRCLIQFPPGIFQEAVSLVFHSRVWKNYGIMTRSGLPVILPFQVRKSTTLC